VYPTGEELGVRLLLLTDRRPRLVQRLTSGFIVIAIMLVALTACANTPSVTLTIGAFSATKAAYTRIFPLFAEYWRQRTGQSVAFRPSYLGSGAQTRDIINGFQADVAALATAVALPPLLARPRSTRFGRFIRTWGRWIALVLVVFNWPWPARQARHHCCRSCVTRPGDRPNRDAATLPVCPSDRNSASPRSRGVRPARNPGKSMRKAAASGGGVTRIRGERRELQC